MTKKEFSKLMDMFDETYPKQPKLTMTQQLMFWVSLQNYELEAVIASFISHTNDTEIGAWKPQVPVNLTRYLQKSDIDIRNKFQEFYDHKNVKDEIAVRVWNKMGGANLLRLTMAESEKKADMFVDLYKQELIGNNYDALPATMKTKLIGVMKK